MRETLTSAWGPLSDPQAYAQLGITSFVIVPFHREGEWKFILAVGDDHPREWRADEVRLLRQVSERVFPRIERAGTELTKIDGDKISFKLPLHDEPEVVFDKDGLTATRAGAFVDHWKMVD